MIELDAAMGRGANDALVSMLASRATIRGRGVRTVERARALVDQGAFRVISTGWRLRAAADLAITAAGGLPRWITSAR